MKPKSKMTGQVFLVGENVAIFLSCYVCKKPIKSLRYQMMGVCKDCLDGSGVELGTTLKVNPPTPATRWN